MESKINVTVRIKPLSEAERAQEKNHIWSQVSENTIANVKTKEMFAFDMVFGDNSTTQQIFDSQIKELVLTAMQGINVTVFAYGQTSSGKTYTMRGYGGKEPGLIPLSIQQVFDFIAGDTERTYQVAVSYLEIYNETLNDLIEPANKSLEIRESISKGIYINRLSECAVATQEQVLAYMWQGDEARIIAETKLNEQSSRSHTVFRINITSKQKDDESKVRVSQLNLVDLAGSEGASRTQTDGLRLREGSNINRSLLALSNVINRLSSASGGKAFINFRDSKLTRILQTALGGNSKTAIICTMTPTLQNYQESVNTLHFGQKAKHVKTTVNVNEISQYGGQAGPEMEKAHKEISDLKAKLKEYETKMIEFQNSMASQITNPKPTEQQDHEMAEVNSEQPKRLSLGASLKDGDLTVQFLKDQLSFVTERLRRAKTDLEEKECLIQKLEHEKREFKRENEALEIENIRLAEKLNDVPQQKIDLTESFSKSKKNQNLDAFHTPNIGKNQNKHVLEQDGIKCFDLERQSILLGLEGGASEDLDLRQSIGLIMKRPSLARPAQVAQIPSQSALEIDDQLFIITELEKLKKENDELQSYVDRINKEKEALKNLSDNSYAMREELELLKEESLFLSEELAKYQRHSSFLEDELQFYKSQNNELLRRLGDCERTLLSTSREESEHNSSVIIYHESQKETQKMLKDENANLKTNIQRLKEEVSRLEMERSKQDREKADTDYNSRASEYNLEILKNQIENISNENMLLRIQSDKQKKSIEIMRSTNERMSQDLEHYKKLSLGKSERQPKKGQTPQPQNLQGGTPFKDRAATPRPSKEPGIKANHSQVEAFHLTVECQQQSIMIDEIITEKPQEHPQLTLIDPKEVENLSSQILYLETELQEKQKRITELDNQLIILQSAPKTAAQPPPPQNESDVVKKLRFDNQILMTKVSEYKKAEKAARELVNDYEQIKLKYFNVLTEISSQKSQISELIESKLNSEISLKDLIEEKEQNINELYSLRMELKKTIEDQAKKGAVVGHLQEELTLATKKINDLMKKDTDLVGLQSDIEAFIGFFSQVDKHMRTLVKLLREFISRCEDPKLIEHNQKQIKSIEGLLEDVKVTIKQSQYQSASTIEAGSNKLIESFFALTNDSLRDVQTSALLGSASEADNTVITQIGGQTISKSSEIMQDMTNSKKLLSKRRKVNDEGEFILQVANSKAADYESADEHGTIVSKKLMMSQGSTISKGQKKLIEKTSLASTAKKSLTLEAQLEKNFATPRRSDKKSSRV